MPPSISMRKLRAEALAQPARLLELLEAASMKAWPPNPDARSSRAACRARAARARRRDRRLRIDHHRGMRAAFPDVGDQTMRLGAHFLMKGDPIRTRIDERGAYVAGSVIIK
jgi:hypothetical protein